MLNRKPKINLFTFLLSLILFSFPVVSFGQTAIQYGGEIRKKALVRYGEKIKKRPRVQYGVDIRVEDIRQIEPGEKAPEEVISDFEFDFRNYIKLSAYYDEIKDDVLTNPEQKIERLDLEERGSTGEINTQFKITYLEDYQFSADVGYQYCAGPGDQNDDDTHFVTNEFYLDLFMAQLAYLKVGKLRDTWGVGWTFTPVQIIEYPKNWVDPYQAREGNYQALLDIPVGNASFRFAYFPHATFDKDTEQGQSGIPDNIKYSGGREDYAARLSLLLWDSDITFEYYYADIIKDYKKNYYGMTFTRYWGDLGVYAEAEGHKGSDMDFIETKTEYIMGNPMLVYYWPSGKELVAIKEPDNKFYVNFSVGVNYTFPDDSKVSLEYYRNNEGYNKEEFDEFREFLVHDSEIFLEGDDKYSVEDDRLADKIHTANKLLNEVDRVRRNYLGITFDRPNTFDDFFPHLNFVIGLDDGSIMIKGTLEYAVRDDTTISFDITGYTGADDTEFGLKTEDYKAYLRLEYFF